MNLRAKIVFSCTLFTIFFTSGCREKSNPSPYGTLLAQQPFSLLTDSIQADPANAGLYYRRAVLLSKNNHPEPALADLRKAWSLQKEERFALGISGILADKQPDSAIAFSIQALHELPQSIWLRLSLAKILDTQNKTDEALNVCDEILTINPVQLDALLLKADLHEKKQQHSESIAALEKAHAIAPRLSEVSYQLAFRYAQAGHEKTILFCDSLIRNDSFNTQPEPRYFKGIYYYNTGQKAKAVEWFTRAIRTNYNFLDAYLDKGKTLYEMKNYNEALKTLQLAATITPTFADAWYWIGRCREALGDKEEARENYLRAYGLDKTLTEAKDAAEKIIIK
jgi:tetratricopeptide (TPR) repeat protein